MEGSRTVYPAGGRDFGTPDEVSQMKVGLAIESDASCSEHLISAVLGVNDALRTFFAGREYGSDLVLIAIGVILVDPCDISDRFHSVRPFDYARLKQFKHPITGQIMEIRNSASWDVKPDFVTLCGMDLEAARGRLCEALVVSTKVLCEHRSRFPDFDVVRFRVDFEVCLRAYCAE